MPWSHLVDIAAGTGVAVVVTALTHQSGWYSAWQSASVVFVLRFFRLAREYRLIMRQFRCTWNAYESLHGTYQTIYRAYRQLHREHSGCVQTPGPDPREGPAPEALTGG